MTLRGMLHDPAGPNGNPGDRDGWRRCPRVARPFRAWRYDFDILNRLVRGELPGVTACPECLPSPKPETIAYDVILVTPEEES